MELGFGPNLTLTWKELIHIAGGGAAPRTPSEFQQHGSGSGSGSGSGYRVSPALPRAQAQGVLLWEIGL